MSRLLPLFDLPLSLPLSTGNPLYDAALTEKLVATRTMSEAEHVKRVWDLICLATPMEIEVLLRNHERLLNDFRLLLAWRCWDQKKDDQVRILLDSLPWKWKLAFPASLIKPARTLFSGWKKDMSFRLIADIRFPELRELYREILKAAPPVIVMKYRKTIRESAALLHFRFEGSRERSIHAWCFEKDQRDSLENLELLSIYLQAKRGLFDEGLQQMLGKLESERQTIPLTSFMGLLSSKQLRLQSKRTPEVSRLRDYAIRCATPVEALLRLKEWSGWITESHVKMLADRIKDAMLSEGATIPFYRVVKAFLQAPHQTRKQILEPLFLPMLKQFGHRAVKLLPPPGPIHWIQPGNYIQFDSLLLHATLASVTDLKLMLIYRDGVETVTGLTLDRLGTRLADDSYSIERWLLTEFGGYNTQAQFNYDFTKLAEALQQLNPQAPLVLDINYGSDEALLAALIPFERVLNLNGAVGAPGEISLTPNYYSISQWTSRSGTRRSWYSASQHAALQFVQFMETLEHFQTLAGEPGAEELL